MSEASKRIVCETLGCEYDKCQWRDDGYGSDESYEEGGGYGSDESNEEVGGYGSGESNEEVGGYGSDVSITSGGYGSDVSITSGRYDNGEDEEVSSGRYNNGGGGYSGGSIKEYKTVKYVEDVPFEEYKEEESAGGYGAEEVEEVVSPTFISNKVEDYQVVEDYDETKCDGVSTYIFSAPLSNPKSHRSLTLLHSTHNH